MDVVVTRLTLSSITSLISKDERQREGRGKDSSCTAFRPLAFILDVC